MKKRVIGLLMAACLVVGATTGCGGGSTATDTSASSAATDEADTEKAEVVEGDFDTVMEPIRQMIRRQQIYLQSW